MAVALFVWGMGMGLWDVAMNVEGAGVEHRLERTIMPRFHALFSLGSVAGAGLGALAARLGVPMLVVLPTVAAAVLVVLALHRRRSCRATSRGSSAPSGDACSARGASRGRS